MRSWAFHIAAFISLMLCVATAILWVRSHETFDNLCRAEPRTCINIVSVGGQLHLEFASADGSLWPQVRTWYTYPRRAIRFSSGPYAWQAVGFAQGHRTNRFASVTTSSHNIVVPYWALLALFLILPGTWLWRSARECGRRARAEHNHCTHCGYDLRATPDRCPECGVAVAQTAIES